MKRVLLALPAVLSFAATARAEEEVIIRGQFPQILARGETVVQMANRMAATMINLDRLIAPPCGMKRVFEFAGADYYDENDLTKRIEPSRRGVWRIAVMGRGCWTPRLHNIFLYPRVGVPAGNPRPLAWSCARRTASRCAGTATSRRSWSTRS
jgi:hypothetical protein